VGGGYRRSCIFNRFSDSDFWTELSVIEWLGTAVIIVIFGMFGDLVESKLKRSINVKDSGNLLPGHGGMLDRFDGLYISLPILYTFLVFFH
jgi:phosphatidate cytidylyltransferase